jgi:LytS/YehU family sensor histidine kinase
LPRSSHSALAAGYQYVLDTRGRTLVPLAEELAAFERVRLLSATRFGDAVRLEVSVGPAAARRWLLPPLTLQELVENAIKHTRFDGDAPLTVRVALGGDVLVVENVLRPRLVETPSTRVGLANLDERTRLAVGRRVAWSVEQGRFVWADTGRDVAWRSRS